jgi:hypothetical protein
MNCMPMYVELQKCVAWQPVHTAALQGEMSPANLFSTVTAAPLHALFPSFQSDEMQLDFCYLPSIPRECCVVSPVILVFGATPRLRGPKL